MYDKWLTLTLTLTSTLTLTLTLTLTYNAFTNTMRSQTFYY